MKSKGGRIKFQDKPDVEIDAIEESIGVVEDGGV
jgi:hypothetical protein